jgi:hypothetical protein
LIPVLELLRVFEWRELSSESSIALLAGFKWSVHVIDCPSEPASGDYGESDGEVACEDSLRQCLMKDVGLMKVDGKLEAASDE